MYKDSDIKKLQYGEPELNLGDGLKAMAWKSKTSFILRKRMKGKSTPLAITLGSVPDMNIEEAQVKASKFRTLIREGIDPKDYLKEEAEKKRFQVLTDTANAVTLRQVLEAKEAHAEATGIGNSENNRKNRRYNICSIYEDWLDKPFAQITRSMITERFNTIASTQNGKKVEWAKQGIRNLSALFTYAMKYHQWIDVNPCSGMSDYTVLTVQHGTSEEKYLEPSEYQRFLRYAHDLHDPIRRQQLAEEFHLTPRQINRDRLPLFDAAAIILLSGLRMREVLHLKWEDVKLEPEEWREDNRDGAYFHVWIKQNKPFGIPITPEMEPYLRRRLEARSDSKYVFPSTRFKNKDKPFYNDEAGHETLNEMLGKLRRISHTNSLALRHTFATVAHNLKFPMDQVAMATGHTSAKKRAGLATHIYVGVQADSYRHIFEATNKALVGDTHADIELISINSEEFADASTTLQANLDEQIERLEAYKKNPTPEALKELEFEDQLLGRVGQKHRDATDKLEAELLDSLIEKKKAIKERDSKS
jgi:integrase